MPQNLLRTKLFVALPRGMTPGEEQRGHDGNDTAAGEGHRHRWSNSYAGNRDTDYCY